MRALAEFVMRGRAQAALVAVIGIGSMFLAWLGAAVVALVLLRKGSGPGSFVLLWAMLPGFLVAVLQQDIGPLAVLLVAALIAWVLRRSHSWSAALVAAAGAGLVLSALLLLTAPAYLAQLAEVLRQIVQDATQGLPEAGTVQAPGVVAIAGILGLSAAATAVLCLLLARWWQAQLYNPGGFRQEFHRLRIPPPLTMLSIVAGVALSSAGSGWTVWAMTAGLPLIFAGFALVHGVVGQRKLSTGWLIAMYCLWLLSDWIKALLLLLAVADSWMNFRGREPSAGSES